MANTPKRELWVIERDNVPQESTVGGYARAYLNKSLSITFDHGLTMQRYVPATSRTATFDDLEPNTREAVEKLLGLFWLNEDEEPELGVLLQRAYTETQRLLRAQTQTAQALCDAEQRGRDAELAEVVAWLRRYTPHQLIHGAAGLLASGKHRAKGGK